MNNETENVNIDYDKDYSIEELKTLPLWDFFQLSLLGGEDPRYTETTADNIEVLRCGAYSPKHTMAYLADPCLDRKNILKGLLN